MLNTTDVFNLKEGNREKPFAFVSYSWADAEVVYRDVKRLQDQGFNLWLDKAKMNERKDSWSEQALQAIYDIDCHVLFFYMSSNSLASESCLKEIMATIDENSRLVHGAPLPVVLIEVEPVTGEASAWIRMLHRKMNSSSLVKDEKTRKCIALSSFREQFFEKKGWDKKIRIGTIEALGEEEYFRKLISNLPEIVENVEPPKPYEEVKKTLFEKIKRHKPNVWLTDKEHTESNDLSFYERLYGVKQLTLVNYAGTSFLAGINIAHAYTKFEVLREWFEKSIVNGSISARVILTNPSGTAAVDAENYKMYPDKRICEQKDIIRMNLNTIMAFRKRYPNANLKVYITDIALPYGIMLAENSEKPEYDYIKVDIYAPVLSSDKKRPSFYLLKSASEHRELYEFFYENAQRIREKHSVLAASCLETSWLCQKPIIHRGVLTDDLQEHTLRAYRACIAEGLPMEVDLLEMRDGELVVQREMDLVTDDETTTLSRFRLETLYQTLKDGEFDEAKTTMLYEMLTFREFLDFVNGRVGLLIELKDFNEDPDNPYHRELAMKVVDQLKGYRGKAAIHSANPFVLREVRRINSLIPIGQISLDYEGKENVDEDYKNLHRNADFLSIVEPDFISYDLDTMRRNPELRRKIIGICREYKIPLLCWTVKKKKDKNFAINTAECDNYIVEGELKS